jgi:hypothetical protein
MTCTPHENALACLAMQVCDITHVVVPGFCAYVTSCEAQAWRALAATLVPCTWSQGVLVDHVDVQPSGT